jgi:hypothetical protein
VTFLGERHGSFARPPRLDDRLAVALTIAVLAVGAFFRLRGMLWDVIPLWLDEAMWGSRVLERPIGAHTIRPLGFMALTRVLFPLAPSEIGLRLLPCLSGLATLATAPFAAKALFERPPARLAFVALLAFHPMAIDFAKEFKPYAGSLALHLVILWLALRFAHAPSLRRLVITSTTCFAGLFFAQDVLFAYPGVFAAAAWVAWRRRDRSLFAGAAIGAAACLALVACHYVFLWSRLDRSRTETYWGNKYDVFYVAPATARPAPTERPPATDEADDDEPDAGADDGHDQTGGEAPTTRLAWTARQYAEMTAFPLERADPFDDPWWTPAHQATLEVVMVALHVAGLAVLIARRRFMTLFLCLAPIATLAVLNAFGRWPFGVFRTNLFTLVPMAAIPVAALDGLAAWRSARGALLFLPALLLVPSFFTADAWHARKRVAHGHSELDAAVERLIAWRTSEGRRGREPLVADNWACRPLRFYMAHDAERRKTWKPVLESSFRLRCVSGRKTRPLPREVERRLAGHPRVWVLVSKRRLMDDIDHKLAAVGNVVGREVFGHGEQMLFVVERLPSPADPAQAVPRPDDDDDSGDRDGEGEASDAASRAADPTRVPSP